MKSSFFDMQREADAPWLEECRIDEVPYSSRYDEDAQSDGCFLNMTSQTFQRED